jgi:hypothetical protein
VIKTGELAEILPDMDWKPESEIDTAVAKTVDVKNSLIASGPGLRRSLNLLSQKIRLTLPRLKALMPTLSQLLLVWWLLRGGTAPSPRKGRTLW